MQRIDASMAGVVSFLDGSPSRRNGRLPAVSLFSGAGISDYGYEMAGFKFRAQSEMNKNRAAIARDNFPGSDMVEGDLRQTWQTLVERVEKRNQRTALLSVTAPCQGMSSSNPARGKVSDAKAGDRDQRNSLLLAAIPVIKALKPQMVVVENVPQLLDRVVSFPGKKRQDTVVNEFKRTLSEYETFTGVVQMADYGIPQLRRRSIIVLLHSSLGCLSRLHDEGLVPWPAPSHGAPGHPRGKTWVTLESWFSKRRYAELDSSGAVGLAQNPDDPLHSVGTYDDIRYSWISDIPPRSGRSGFENSNCRNCKTRDVPVGRAYCQKCKSPMRNRPHIDKGRGRIRLIRGFGSSYRRMPAGLPARTITTASSHMGSDYTVHPWENRLLSIRECAELQTVPRCFRWNWALESGHRYLMRQVIGEAMPAWFTYQHGIVLKNLLRGDVIPTELAKVEDTNK